MPDWNTFADQEPDLAEKGEGLLFQYGPGLAFLATVRKDGGPRVHPVCPIRSGSGLFVLIRPDSPKRWDLLRSGRFALQSFPEDKPDSDEFYLAGKALPVYDQTRFRQVLADAAHHTSPDEILFELHPERVMHTTWEGFGTEDYHPERRTWQAESPTGDAPSGKTLRRADRGISQERAREILVRGDFGVLSVIDPSGIPYGVPLNYCLIGDTIYFHCALEGRKIDAIRQNPRVSFAVVGESEVAPAQFTTRYTSCLVEGLAREASGEEKHRALLELVEKYAPEHTQEGRETIRKYDPKTRVFGITIDRLTGKANE